MGQNENGRGERRRESRWVAREDRVYIQIVDADERKLVGMTRSCQVVDVAGAGIRLLADTYIPDGTRLDLWLDDTSRHGKFFLTGEVRWASESARGQCELGVEMLDSPASDIAEWRQRYGR